MARETRTRQKVGAKKVMRKSGKSPEIRCMLIPTEMETLLLPTTSVAQVIDFSLPEPMENAPSWLLGQIVWEDRQVPVFSFSALINGSDAGEVDDRSKIIVLKSLTDSARVPFLGLILADLPKPIVVRDNTLVATGDEKKSLGVFSRITIENEEAIIPDLDRLTHLVTHATFGALPITQLDQ